MRLFASLRILKKWEWECTRHLLVIAIAIASVRVYSVPHNPSAPVRTTVAPLVAIACIACITSQRGLYKVTKVAVAIVTGVFFFRRSFLEDQFLTSISFTYFFGGLLLFENGFPLLDPPTK